ncbi:hypothetical protein ACH4PU_33360 [Streptomyces sp. NPDC021100]|uniref:hypothetical protein n=1 Tax=Streptomyces sp. NPDC021100 TaxID=3365114 RepID=UPI0037A01858
MTLTVPTPAHADTGCREQAQKAKKEYDLALIRENHFSSNRGDALWEHHLPLLEQQLGKAYEAALRGALDSCKGTKAGSILETASYETYYKVLPLVPGRDRRKKEVLYVAYLANYAFLLASGKK